MPQKKATPPITKLAIIGFGEAGQAFAQGWGERRAAATWSYDRKTDDVSATSRDEKWADFARAGVTGCISPAEALIDANLVFSLVTADQALSAAENAAPHLSSGTLYFDCNSCAPGTKRQAAAMIEDAGGRYVDTAVMAPVLPLRHKTPLLISGPHGEAACRTLDQLGMNSTDVSGTIGTASSVKMVRSIMIKGLEALFLECVLSGRKAGVDLTVLDSLDVSFPGFDFKKKAAYMMERVMTHGQRRAEEMKAVTQTIYDLGLPNSMAQATAEWDRRVGDLRMKAEDSDYGTIADALLARMVSQEDAA